MKTCAGGTPGTHGSSSFTTPVHNNQSTHQQGERYVAGAVTLSHKLATDADTRDQTAVGHSILSGSTLDSSPTNNEGITLRRLSSQGAREAPHRLGCTWAELQSHTPTPSEWHPGCVQCSKTLTARHLGGRETKTRGRPNDPLGLTRRDHSLNLRHTALIISSQVARATSP